MQHKHIGGSKGYWFRRCIHLSTLAIPIIYYLPQYTQRSLQIMNALFVLILGIVFVFELFRIRYRIIIIGQRDYEKVQISGFAWSIIGIVLILLLAPKYGQYGAAYGLPLIWNFALIDPILGEARSRKLQPWAVAIIGLCLAMIIWLISYWWLGTPWQLIPFIVPISVAAEMIKIPHVDDNINLLLVPLLVVLLFHQVF